MRPTHVSSTVRLALAGAMLLALSPAALSQQQDLVVFGDSLSDTGLVWQRLQIATGRNLPVSPPYAQGRFSNGPVAVEYMAQAMGATLDNHAWGGATTGEDNILDEAGELAHTGVTAQVQQYLSGQGTHADPRALYLLWAGGNDLIFTPDEAAATLASQQLLQAADTLYQAGARRFMVPLMPDLSRLPLLGSTPDAALYQDISANFNARLTQGLASLRIGHADATWLSFDTPAFITTLIGQEGGGFVNADQACVKGSFSRVHAVCATPSDHVFWDSSHFTTGVHAQLGAAMAAAAVPEPASAAHMLWGLGGLLCLIRWGGAPRMQRGQRLAPCPPPDQLE